VNSTSKTLIKADIVAILIHLKPELLERVQDLDKYTVAQLNAMVRSIIYDVRRIDALLIGGGDQQQLSLCGV
jgi:hypothetical protein